MCWTTSKMYSLKDRLWHRITRYYEREFCVGRTKIWRFSLEFFSKISIVLIIILFVYKSSFLFDSSGQFIDLIIHNVSTPDLGPYQVQTNLIHLIYLWIDTSNNLNLIEIDTS